MPISNAQANVGIGLLNAGLELYTSNQNLKAQNKADTNNYNEFLNIYQSNLKKLSIDFNSSQNELGLSAIGLLGQQQVIAGASGVTNLGLKQDKTRQARLNLLQTEADNKRALEQQKRAEQISLNSRRKARQAQQRANTTSAIVSALATVAMVALL